MAITFGEIQRNHAAFVARHALSEETYFREQKAGNWLKKWVVIDRQPVDALGNVIVNTIRVFADRTAIPFMYVDESEFALAGDGLPDQPRRVYRVKRVLGRERGSYWVEAVQ